MKYRKLKLLSVSVILFLSHSALQADDYSLASFSDTSIPFDLPTTKVSSGVTSFGSVVFNDINNNGILDADEKGVADVVVKLFDKNGSEINVGPDGILGTEDDAPGGVVTNSKGRYFFSKINHDYYRIQIEWNKNS